MTVDDAAEGAIDSGLFARDEIRVQRRKAAFRRRAAIVLFGVAGVIAIAMWQRARTNVARCGESLLAYGHIATTKGFERQPPEFIEASWAQIEDDGIVSPDHFRVHTYNWLAQPRDGDGVPLATCAVPHWTITGRGRNVLYRTADGFVVRFEYDKD